ncbi:MAG: peptidoglycan-associated lipoprotein Pal [Gammaproteobacteria bacterium]|nr:peptidoglycan-associated lipoprotein Pal [Gammaproteobacteria bacterium]
MTKTLSNALLTLLAAVAITACSSLDKKPAPPASVENRGISGNEMSDIDAAKSKGMAGDTGGGANALNDPKSPLATRVIYFDYDSTTIRQDFAAIVQAHATYLAANQGVSITVEGHADERGTPEYNLALGERRALAIRKQLVLLGASAGQIKTVSYGEERPIALGHDEQAYSLNRRAELIYP